jgi:hypothetical protein
MASYIVQCVFQLGVSGEEYILPHIYKVSDPKEGIKATVIEGTRGDGVIVIPGGRKSQEITIQGRLFDNDGYADLTTLITEMKNMITTDQATLTLQHWTGSTWQQDWQYTVRRLNEIEFPESLRTWDQPYSVSFLVIAY